MSKDNVNSRKLGIVSALEQEAKALRNSLRDPTSIHVGELVFWTGSLSGLPVVISQCGVGKVNATMCTQVMIDRFSPSAIIFTGVAGGILPGMKVGDIVVSTHACQYDYDISVFRGQKGYIPTPRQLSQIDPDAYEMVKGLLGAKAVARLDGVRLIEADGPLRMLVCKAYDDLRRCRSNMPALYVGTIASGDTFVSSQDAKINIQREFGAVCVEMEGAATAYTCACNDVPFLIVRSISDLADGGAPDSFAEFCLTVAELSASLVTHFAGILAQRISATIENEHKWIVPHIVEPSALSSTGGAIQANRESIHGLRSRIRAVVEKFVPCTGEWMAFDLSDSYFDTAERDLAKARAYVRVRERDSERWLMSKLPGTRQRSFFTRRELSRKLVNSTEPIRSNQTLRDVAPGSATIEDVNELAASAKIDPIDVWVARPCVVIVNHRSVLPIRLSENTALSISIDDYFAMGPEDDSQRVANVEIELEVFVSQSSDSDNEKVARITKALEDELRLTPSSMSKYEVGLEALRESV